MNKFLLLLVAVLIAVAVFLGDVSFLPGFAFPAAVYAFPVLVAAYFLSPRLVVVASVCVLALEILAANIQAVPVWVYPLDILGVAIIAVISTLLSAKRYREAEEAKVRSQLLEQIENDRALLDAVLRQMPEAVAIVQAPAARLLLANEQLERIFRHPFAAGSTVEEFSTQKACHPDGNPYRPDEWPLVRSTRSDETVADEEMFLEETDGTGRSLRVTSTPIRNRDNQVIAAVGLFQDITVRKQRELERERLVSQLQDVNEKLVLTTARAEQKADESTRRATELDAIIAAMAEPMIIYNADRVPVLANPAAVAMYGVDPTGQDRSFLIDRIALRYPDGRPVADADWPSSRALRNQKVISERFIFSDPQKQDRIALISASPLSTNGNIWGTVSVWHDITEEQRLLKESERRAAEIDAIISSMADGVVVYDRNGKITRANPAALDIVGLSASHLGLTLAELAATLRIETEDNKPFSVEALPANRALRGDTVRSVRLIVTTPAGKRVWITVSSAPVRASDGELLGSVTVFTDTTRLREIEEQREDYVRAVTHDVRNPLATILAQAEFLARLLGKDGLKVVELRSAEAIADSAKHIDRMVQDMVESVRLEARQVSPSLQPLNLGSFMSGLLETARSTLDTRRVHLKISPQMPPVLADPGYLERVLINLVSNALKYSYPESPVQIGAERLLQEIVVSVVNQGAGIAAEELPHAFDRFFRAKGVLQPEGLGLGLHITKMLVQAQGGRIWVDSEPEKETVFSFTLRTA